MVKKILLCACLTALTLLGAGCGRQQDSAAAGGISSSAASPPDLSAESGLIQEPAASGDDEEAPAGITFYTLDRSIAVDGRRLTLRLHGRTDTTAGFQQLGISAIDVLEGDSLLQTISIGDAFDQLYREIGLEDEVGQDQWTDCWTEDGGLSIDDLNFDGFPDLRLMAGVGVVNISYLCWLWDPEAGQFVYAFELVGYDVRIDSGAQQLVTETRDGYGQYYTRYYRYDNETEELLLLKEIHEDYTAGTGTGDFYEPAVTIYELVDGVWTQTG